MLPLIYLNIFIFYYAHSLNIYIFKLLNLLYQKAWVAVQGESQALFKVEIA